MSAAPMVADTPAASPPPERVAREEQASARGSPDTVQAIRTGQYAAAARAAQRAEAAQTAPSVQTVEDAAPRPREWQMDDRIRGVLISCSGLKRVTPRCLLDECDALRHARTVREVGDALRLSLARLEEIGVFKSVNVEGVAVTPDGSVEVALAAEERTRSFTVGGNVDRRGEMTCDVKAEQPALFGGPLSVGGSASSSASHAHEFSMRLSTPRFCGHRCTSSLEVARIGADETVPSSYSDRSTGAMWRLASPTGAHTLTFEAALRDLFPATGSGHNRLPSLEVQQARLRSVKTSAKYSFDWAWRHAALLAPWTTMGDPRRSGSMGSTTLQGHVEAAGGAGDVRFLRGEAQLSTIWPLPWGGLQWFGALSGGVLLPRDGRPSCLQDRFFIGGASGSTAVVKGFAHRGLGPVGQCQQRVAEALDQSSTPSTPTPRRPTDGGRNKPRMVDALGGDAMVCAYSTLSAPLPSQCVAALGLGDVQPRLFGFVGAGSVVERAAGGPTALSRELRTGFRASTGLGLAIPVGGIGVLELTLARPFWARRHDSRQCWQVGLRLEATG